MLSGSGLPPPGAWCSQVLVIDGIDEAAQQRDVVLSLILEQLVPMGLRVVCTSRPEAVELRHFWSRFVIVNLKPLSPSQQQQAMDAQLRAFPAGAQFAHHLTSFVKIRKDHDERYKAEFSTKVRKQIEAFDIPDRLMLEDGKTRDGSMRQRAADGGFVRLAPGSGEQQWSPASWYLQELSGFFTPVLLTELDGRLEGLTAADKEAVQRAVMALQHEGIVQLVERHGASLLSDEAIKKRIKSEAREDVEGGREAAVVFGRMNLAVKLSLLVLDRRDRLASGHADGPANSDGNHLRTMPPPCARATELWPLIVRRTDLIYVACEALPEAVDQALQALCEKLNLGRDALLLGELKDPVRIHEKALSDYVHDFNDWDDGTVIPEACVLDVLRARIVCPDAETMLALQVNLERGVVIGGASSVDGGGDGGPIALPLPADAGESGSLLQGARLKLVRSKNKFRTCDPTHFRNILNNLQLVLAGGRAVFVEAQVQHSAA